MMPVGVVPWLRLRMMVWDWSPTLNNEKVDFFLEWVNNSALSPVVLWLCVWLSVFFRMNWSVIFSLLVEWKERMKCVWVTPCISLWMISCTAAAGEDFIAPPDDQTSTHNFCWMVILCVFDSCCNVASQCTDHSNHLYDDDRYRVCIEFVRSSGVASSV